MAKMKGARLEQAMPEITKDTATKEPTDIMNDWEAKDHLNTLIQAHGIMADPDKMAKVHKLAGAHTKAIRGLNDINNFRNAKYGGSNATKKPNLQTLASGGANDNEAGE